MAITLSTVGSSVFLGGFSTLCGVIPLAFTSSQIFFTVFVAFLSVVLLGLGHGLILLPVLLSLVGPTENVKEAATSRDEKKLASPHSAMDENMNELIENHKVGHGPEMSSVQTEGKASQNKKDPKVLMRENTNQTESDELIQQDQSSNDGPIDVEVSLPPTRCSG